MRDPLPDYEDAQSRGKETYHSNYEPGHPRSHASYLYGPRIIHLSEEKEGTKTVRRVSGEWIDSDSRLAELVGQTITKAGRKENEYGNAVVFLQLSDGTEIKMVDLPPEDWEILIDEASINKYKHNDVQTGG